MDVKKDNILLQRAQELRKNATKEENHLWYDFLRKHSMQFYRQKIIGNFIVDFYCPKMKLVIELDGSQHYEESSILYDRKRTELLQELGIIVMRFTNTDINNNFEGVCESIDAYIRNHS